MKLVSRPIEQANLVLGCEGLSRTDERRFALGVLNAALGGGMSSRLFQEVREKRGLAYSVYSFASQHADTGLWGVYVGCLPSKADEVLSICVAEVAKVVESGLTDAELDRGKGQVRGGIVLGLEDPSSRMTRLGKSELVYPDLEPVDEILAAIDAVTHDDIRAIAAEVLTRPKVLAVVGPFDDPTRSRRCYPSRRLAHATSRVNSLSVRRQVRGAAPDPACRPARGLFPVGVPWRRKILRERLANGRRDDQGGGGWGPGADGAAGVRHR